jgi:hypothetical protein
VQGKQSWIKQAVKSAGPSTEHPALSRRPECKPREQPSSTSLATHVTHKGECPVSRKKSYGRSVPPHDDVQRKHI